MSELESSVSDVQHLQDEYAACLRRIADWAEIEGDAKAAAQWGTVGGRLQRFCMWVENYARKRRLEEIQEREFWLDLMRHNHGGKR